MRSASAVSASGASCLMSMLISWVRVVAYSRTLLQSLGFFAQLGTLPLHSIDPAGQAAADALLGLPCPFLAHVSADALKMFHAGAVAPVALVEDGPNGGQAEAGLVGDGAQRLAGRAQLDDGLPLCVAGGQWSAYVAPAHHGGVEVCDVAIPFAN